MLRMASSPSVGLDGNLAAIDRIPFSKVSFSYYEPLRSLSTKKFVLFPRYPEMAYIRGLELLDF
jgi:hypothetical protein